MLLLLIFCFRIFKQKKIFEIDIIDILQSIYLSNNNFFFLPNATIFFFFFFDALSLIVDSYKSYDIFFMIIFLSYSTKQKKTSPPFFSPIVLAISLFRPFFFPIVILIPSIHSMILVKLFDFFFCR